MKSVFFAVLAVVFSVAHGSAQGKSGKYLTIGDQCPDFHFKMLHYSSNDLTVSSFKGKLLILDLWATWCQPCRQFLLSSDSLEKAYGGKIVVLPVTYEDSSTVFEYLSDMQQVNGHKIASAFDGKEIHDRFFFNMLPHVIWVDGTGRIIGITDEYAFNPVNINDALAGKAQLKLKTDDAKVDVDVSKPYLGDLGKLGIDGSHYFYKSVFTDYMPAIAPQTTNRGNSITLIDLSPVQMYQYIAGRFHMEYIAPNRIKLDVRDTSKIQYPHDREAAIKWQQKNVFCYELNLLDTTMESRFFDVALDELNGFCGSRFGVYGRIEEREMECYALVRTAAVDLLMSKGGTPGSSRNAFKYSIRNEKLTRFVEMLQALYLQTSPYPVIDETGIWGNIDMELTCNLSDIASINSALEKYGLKFEKKEAKISIIVIHDLPEKM
jgi:thiol-disulfide isomerase/thioredoxin